MRNLKGLLLIVAVLMGATPLTLSAKGKNSSAKIIGVEKSSYKSKRSKKAVRNYTHTLPADGARTATWSAAKKYHKIMRLMLKSPYQKSYPRKLK